MSAPSGMIQQSIQQNIQQNIQPNIQQSRPNALTARPALQLKTTSTVMRPSMNTRPFSKPQPMQSPAMALMTKATSLPLGVPAFRPIPPAEHTMQNSFNRKTTMSSTQQQQRFPNAINNSVSNNFYTICVLFTWNMIFTLLNRLC